MSSTFAYHNCVLHLPSGGAIFLIRAISICWVPEMHNNSGIRSQAARRAFQRRDKLTTFRILAQNCGQSA